MKPWSKNERTLLLLVDGPSFGARFGRQVDPKYGSVGCQLESLRVQGFVERVPPRTGPFRLTQLGRRRIQVKRIAEIVEAQS